MPCKRPRGAVHGRGEDAMPGAGDGERAVSDARREAARRSARQPPCMASWPLRRSAQARPRDADRYTPIPPADARCWPRSGAKCDGWTDIATPDPRGGPRRHEDPLSVRTAPARVRRAQGLCEASSTPASPPADGAEVVPLPSSAGPCDGRGRCERHARRCADDGWGAAQRACPSLPFRRPEAAEVVFRGM